MEYAEAKKIAETLHDNRDKCSDIMRQFPRGTMGLAPDAVKATPEWQQAKRNSNKALADLRRFNSYYVKAFKKERRADSKFQ